MKVHYTGSPGSLTPTQRKKLESKFAKLSKLFDRKEEKEAHVILTAVRHRHNAEITVNYYDHPMAAAASEGDVFLALTSAIERLEKQIQKTRSKWRDTKRGSSATTIRRPSPEPARELESKSERHVFRVNSHATRKPMTLEEAVLAMEKARDYMVYRDADTDRISVLLRRKDGHFDLIEA